MSTPADVTISDIQVDGNFRNIQQLREQVKALWGTTASQGDSQHALELTTLFMRNGYTHLACVVAATTGYTGNDNVIGLLNNGRAHEADAWARSHSIAANPATAATATSPGSSGTSLHVPNNLPTWAPSAPFQALSPVTAYAAMLRAVGKKQKDDQWFPAGASINDVNAELAKMTRPGETGLVYGQFVDPPSNNQNTARGPYDLPGWDPNKPWKPVNPDAPDYNLVITASSDLTSTTPVIAGVTPVITPVTTPSTAIPTAAAASQTGAATASGSRNDQSSFTSAQTVGASNTGLDNVMGDTKSTSDENAYGSGSGTATGGAAIPLAEQGLDKFNTPAQPTDDIGLGFDPTRPNNQA